MQASARGFSKRFQVLYEGRFRAECKHDRKQAYHGKLIDKTYSPEVTVTPPSSAGFVLAKKANALLKNPNIPSKGLESGAAGFDFSSGSAILVQYADFIPRLK
jgi:hypothetical protein